MPQGAGLAAVLVKRATTVELDWGTRQKSHFAATDSAGRVLGVTLPHGTLVRSGDVLVAEDGSLIKVVAAPQPVLLIAACSQHGSAFDLTRAAYYLGTHQVAIELTPDHLKIEPNPALADLLRAMHLTVSEALDTFEPQSSARAPAAAPALKPAKSIIPIAAAKPHVHGPGCGHDHGHGHSV